MTVSKTRYWLFVSLLLLVPMSKYPSLSKPILNFPSFRFGLYQLVLLFFVLFCLPNVIKGAHKLYTQQKAALISLLLLFLILLLGIFSSINKPRSFLLISSISLLVLTVVSAWWYVAEELPRSSYKNIGRLLLIAGCVYGIFSIVQFLLAGFANQNLGLLCKGCGSQVFGFPRISGLAAEPQFHANAMMVYFFFGLGMYYHSRSRLALSSCLLSIMAIGLTLSRGAFVAVAVGLLLFYTAAYLQKKISIRTIIRHFLTVFVVSLAVGGLLIGAASFRYRSTPDIAYKTLRSLLEQTSLGVIKLPSHDNTSGFQPAGLVVASGNERLSAAKLALRAWSYNPLTIVIGVGGGNLGPFVNRHIDANAPSNLTVYIYYILLLAEVGLLGLLSFALLGLAAIVSLLKKFWHQPDALPYMALVSLLVAFFVQYGFFGSYINVPYIWLFIGIGLGLYPRKNTKRRYNSSSS